MTDNPPLKTGLGIEGIVSYNFIPNFGVYAGWGWNRFFAEQSFAGPKIDFEEAGYTYGLQYFIPLGTTGDTKVIFRGGGAWSHFDMKNNEWELIGDTGHGIGWQLESGLTVPFADNWKIQPSIRYRSLSRELPFGNSSVDTNLKNISLGLGVLWTF